MVDRILLGRIVGAARGRSPDAKHRQSGHARRTQSSARIEAACKGRAEERSYQGRDQGNPASGRRLLRRAGRNRRIPQCARSVQRGRCEVIAGPSGAAMAEQEYELFAIRYATREARRADHFIGGDPHDGSMPMDYFVWVAKSAERAFVIDCGFTEETAKKRKRTFLRDPIEALKLVGVDGDAVGDVILTH